MSGSFENPNSVAEPSTSGCTVENNRHYACPSSPWASGSAAEISDPDPDQYLGSDTQSTHAEFHVQPTLQHHFPESHHPFQHRLDTAGSMLHWEQTETRSLNTYEPGFSNTPNRLDRVSADLHSFDYTESQYSSETAYSNMPAQTQNDHHSHYTEHAETVAQYPAHILNEGIIPSLSYAGVRSSFSNEQNSPTIYNNARFASNGSLLDQSSGYLQVPSMSYHGQQGPPTLHPNSSSGLVQSRGSSVLGHASRPKRSRSSRNKSPALAREGFIEVGSALIENKCPYCSAILVDGKGLRKHARLHQEGYKDSFQYKCQTCNLTFQHPKDLNRHELTHDDNPDRRIYKCTVEHCPYADKGFKRRDHLKRHLEKQHRTTLSEEYQQQHE